MRKKRKGTFLTAMGGYLIILLTIAGCSNPFIKGEETIGEKAVKDSDVVFNQEGKITSNQDKLETFIQNVKNGKKDKIRIVRNTIEGDPIFDTLNSDGEKIEYTYDNSQDAFGGSDKGEEKATCAKLESKNSDSGIKYFLTGCSADIGKYFEFEITK
jgi:hypothetical protein